MNITRAHFGFLPDGREASLFTLKNNTGMVASITDFGGIVTSLMVPDRFAQPDDVVLGFRNFSDYLSNSPYFGCIVGRYANRIAFGKFNLNGHEYQLTRNHGLHTLHGGETGLNKVLWDSKIIDYQGVPSLQLLHVSPDGNEGFPGNLEIKVTFQLTDDQTFTIFYEAVTDAPTPVNLTHHGYFNLAGESAGNILQHEICLAADKYTGVDADCIPTGEWVPVENTIFDLRSPVRFSDRIPRFIDGYDHNFILNKPFRAYGLAGHVYDPGSGRQMKLFTTEPGVQLYTSNFIDGSLKGKSGQPYGKWQAVCLEAQQFPDAPNHAAFPDTILHPGEKYWQQTSCNFSVR